MGASHPLSGWIRRLWRLGTVWARLAAIALLVGVAAVLPLLLVVPILYLLKVGDTLGVLAIAVVTLTSYIYFLIKIGGPLHRRWIHEHDFTCTKCGRSGARYRILGSVSETEGVSDTFEFRCRLCGHADVTS